MLLSRIWLAATLLLAIAGAAAAQTTPAPVAESAATMAALPVNDCAATESLPWVSPPAVTEPTAQQMAEGSPVGAKPPEASPASLKRLQPNAVMKCAGGLIELHVSAAVWENHHTAQKIPVTLEILLRGPVLLDLNSLETLDNGSGFAFASDPQFVVRKVDEGIMITWSLVVQSTNTRDTYLPLSFSLKYALPKAGSAPIYQDLVTPSLMLQRYDSSPVGLKAPLRVADVTPLLVRVSWAYVPSLVAALTCFGLALLLYVIRRINRQRPRQLLAPVMVAWLRLDEIIKSGVTLTKGQSSRVFTQEHYGEISQVLKTYLKAIYPELNFWDSDSVTAGLAGKEHEEAILRALESLDGVVYRSRHLSEQEHDQLLRDLIKIVPKPFLA